MPQKIATGPHIVDKDIVDTVDTRIKSGGAQRASLSFQRVNNTYSANNTKIQIHKYKCK